MPRKIDTQSTTKEAHSAKTSKFHGGNARASATDKNSHDKQAHTSVAVEPTTTKPTSQMHLSKSQYLRGVQCHKRLWLYKYKPQAQDTPTQSQLARFQAGNEVGEIALKLFDYEEKIVFSESNFKNELNTNTKTYTSKKHTNKHTKIQTHTSTIKRV